jgi:hypothetical protein
VLHCSYTGHQYCCHCSLTPLPPKALVVNDDLRAQFSGTFDTAKECNEAGALALFLSAAKAADDLSEVSLLAHCVGTVRAFTVSNEATKAVGQRGGLELCRSVLSRHGGDRDAARATVALVRNLAANDDYKAKMGADETLALVVGAMSAHEGDGVVVEHGLASFAQLTLRNVKNANKICETNGAEVALQAMRAHPAKQALQRQGCLALRNIVSRNRDLCPLLLDLGAEDVIRQAGNHAGAVDTAYAALRDLGCEAEVTTWVQTDKGMVMQKGPEMFGQGSNKGFNTTVATTNGIEDRMNEAAEAPGANDPNW